MKAKPKNLKGIILLALTLLLFACNNDKQFIDLNYGGYNLKIFQSKEEVLKYIKSTNQEVSFEDSYPKANEGIDMYYYYSDMDSITSRIELYFYNSVLQGVNINSFSKKLSPERFFEKMDNEVLPKFQKSIMDTKNDLLIEKSKNDKIDSGGVRQSSYSIDLKTKELSKFY